VSARESDRTREKESEQERGKSRSRAREKEHARKRKHDVASADAPLARYRKQEATGGRTVPVSKCAY